MREFEPGFTSPDLVLLGLMKPPPCQNYSRAGTRRTDVEKENTMTEIATVTVQSVTEIANVIPRMVGFMPTHSLVVVGLKGAPTARIDLGNLDEIAEALAPALPHWLPEGVVLAVYSPVSLVPVWLQAIIFATDTLLPGVEVRAAFGVSDSYVVHADGSRERLALVETGAPGLDDVPVAYDREAQEAKALLVTDAETAVTLAVQGWLSGDGAWAWIMHDRAIALGSTDPRLARLVTCIEQVIRPEDSGLA